MEEKNNKNNIKLVWTFWRVEGHTLESILKTFKRIQELRMIEAANKSACLRLAIFNGRMHSESFFFFAFLIQNVIAFLKNNFMLTKEKNLWH